MYARVMSLKVQEGKIDELITAVEESVEPVLHNMEGFQAGFMFTDPSTNTALSITIWDTEDQMLSSEQIPIYIERISKMTALLERPPEPQHFEAPICAWFGPASDRTKPD